MCCFGKNIKNILGRGAGLLVGQNAFHFGSKREVVRKAALTEQLSICQEQHLKLSVPVT